MHKAPTGTTLAFDFGEVRIGVAEGDAEVGTAHPLATVTGEGNEAKFAAIAKLVAEWKPRQLVAGLPAHTDGSEHELTRLCRKFGRRLHWALWFAGVLGGRAFVVTFMPKARWPEAQAFGRKQKAVLDQVAAQAILQGFFEGGAAEYFNGREAAGED